MDTYFGIPGGDTPEPDCPLDQTLVQNPSGTQWCADLPHGAGDSAPILPAILIVGLVWAGISKIITRNDHKESATNA